MSDPFVSVIVPAYNEGDCIQSTLGKITGYLRARFSRFEVIVVDDGSTDDTGGRVSEFAAREPSVRLVAFSENRGKGFVVRQGVLAARGDAVFFTDADLSTPVEEIEKGLAGLEEGHPMVIASRRHSASVIALGQGRGREAVGRAFNRFVKSLLSLPFDDTQCGFKCFTGAAAREIFSLARINGFAFDVEAIVIARSLGYRVYEIPVRWTNSPDSKVRPVRDLLFVLKDLLGIYWNEKKGLYKRR
ncbi:MAG TPA: dolichyl-phosphate beta-glucosyltransferase [Candidatus Binatia bacterium]